MYFNIYVIVMERIMQHRIKLIIHYCVIKILLINISFLVFIYIT